VKFVNPIIGFKFRFKGALDAQVISLLCLFLMILFKLEFIRYIGILLSAIYLFLAMMTIVRIEIQRKAFHDKGKED
jgi:Na+/H+ antiporter NhaD/arsenite permease-like protein